MSENKLTIEEQIDIIRPNRAYRRLHKDCFNCGGDGYIVNKKEEFVEVCKKYKKRRK